MVEKISFLHNALSKEGAKVSGAYPVEVRGARFRVPAQVVLTTISKNRVKDLTLILPKILAVSN